MTEPSSPASRLEPHCLSVVQVPVRVSGLWAVAEADLRTVEGLSLYLAQSDATTAFVNNIVEEYWLLFERISG